MWSIYIFFLILTLQARFLEIFFFKQAFPGGVGLNLAEVAFWHALPISLFLSGFPLSYDHDCCHLTSHYHEWRVRLSLCVRSHITIYLGNNYLCFLLSFKQDFPPLLFPPPLFYQEQQQWNLFIRFSLSSKRKPHCGSRD